MAVRKLARFGYIFQKCTGVPHAIHVPYAKIPGLYMGELP